MKIDSVSSPQIRFIDSAFHRLTARPNSLSSLARLASPRRATRRCVLLISQTRSSAYLLPYQGDDLTATTTRQNLTVADVYTPEAPRKITQEERDFKAYRTLRDARSNARYDGVRKIRAAKKEEEEANKKK